MREQGGDHPAARGFALSLLDHLQRALVGQSRNRSVAERERVGQCFDQISLGRLLLVALGRVRVRHALDGGAVDELVVGLVAYPLAIRTKIGVGSRLESVVGLGHLLGRLREVPLEGTVGALQAGREPHFLPCRRRLGSRRHRKQHQSRCNASNSLHWSSPFNDT